MKITKLKCPECGSTNTIKNGTNVAWRAGRRKMRVQKYLCNDCGRQFRLSRAGV